MAKKTQPPDSDTPRGKQPSAAARRLAQKRAKAAGAQIPRGNGSRKVTGAKSNGLARLRPVGPSGHKDAVEHARELRLITQRQLTVWKLYEAGATLHQIADELAKQGTPVHYTTVWRDLIEVKDALPQYKAQQAHEVLKARAQTRVDTIYRTFLPKMLSPKKTEAEGAARILLQALDREAKLIGYDAEKAEGPSPEQFLEVLRGIMRDYLELAGSNVEMQQRMAEILRRRAAMLGAPILDVEASASEE